MLNLFKKLYYTPNNPTSFGSINKLHNASNKRYDIQQVRDWLAKQDTYTLHKNRRIRFKRSRYYVPGINHLFQADLCDMQSLAKYNDGIRYILTVIDVFSKKAWAFPLKTKQAGDVIVAFTKLFREQKPEYLQTDKGKEFLASTVQALFRNNDVKFYYTNNADIKAAVVERFNRTLKEKMFKYFTFKETRRYIDVLQDFIDSYNNSIHSATNKAPNDVSHMNEAEVYNNLYEGSGRYKKKPLKSTKHKFNVGDHVRISRQKLLFEKGYEENWTQEIFIVSNILNRYPIRYELTERQHGEEGEQRYGNRRKD